MTDEPLDLDDNMSTYDPTVDDDDGTWSVDDESPAADEGTQDPDMNEAES